MSASEQTSASKREPIQVLKNIAAMTAISGLPEHLHALIIDMKEAATTAIKEHERPSPQQQPDIVRELRETIEQLLSSITVMPRPPHPMYHSVARAEAALKLKYGQPDELSKAQARIAELELKLADYKKYIPYSHPDRHEK